MHPLDIAFCIVAIVFIVIGIKRGLIGEIVRLAAMVVGFLVAFLFFKDLYTGVSFLSRMPQQTGQAIAFVLLYIITALLIIGAGWIIHQVANLTPLGLIDKIFGGVIGFIKTAMIAWVACLSISTFPLSYWQSSLVYKSYEQLPSWLHYYDLEKFRKHLKKSSEKETPKRIDTMLKGLDSFKAKVDSAKNVHHK